MKFFIIFVISEKMAEAQKDPSASGLEGLQAPQVRQNLKHDHTYTKMSKKEPRIFSERETALLKYNWDNPPELPQELEAIWNRSISAFAFGHSCSDIVYTVIDQDFIKSMGDYLEDLNHLRPVYTFEMSHQLKFTKRYKCNFGLHAVFVNTSEENDTEQSDVHMFLWLRAKVIDLGTDLDYTITSILTEFADKISSSERGPSSLVFKEFLSSTLSISLYKLEFGGHLDSYFNLPHSISRRKALDPVFRSASNRHDHCFRTALFHYFNQQKIELPQMDMELFRPFMTLKDIAKFEMKHSQMQIFVLAAEMQENNPDNLDHFYLAYKSKNAYSENTHQINLFLHEDHYYLVTNLSKLLASSDKRGYLKNPIFCLNCFSEFTSRQRLKKHMIYCQATENTVPSFPRSKLEFTNYDMLLQIGMIVFYDCETSHSTVKNNEKATYTNYVNELKPLKVGMKYYFPEREVLERDPLLQSLEEIKIFTGDDCVSDFLKYLKECSWKVQERIRETVPLKMTESDWENFKSAEKCGKN